MDGQGSFVFAVETLIGGGLMDPFVEIELGGGEVRGEALPPRGARAAEVLAPQDEGQRAKFTEMRALARRNPYPRLDWGAVYYNAEQYKSVSEIFLRQARFMAGFTDDWDGGVPFSSYYPVYQMMSYEQLRTYFSWRTKVRENEAEVPPASASYAFLYVYELINQIGTGGTRRGLEMLTKFWQAYKRRDAVLDKHMARWLKDYHIYYNIPGYRDLAGGVNAEAEADATSCECDRFDLLAGVSSHNITGGGFYNEETAPLIREAVICAVGALSEKLAEAGMDWNRLLFPLSPPKLEWKPFAHALFVPDANRPDSVTALSPEEIYICRNLKWTRRTAKHGNRRLVGYILKKTEECLRKLTRYKRAFAADLSMLESGTLSTLQACGVYIDSFIEETVSAFYAEKNKIVVSVDRHNLVKIREESLVTQERLLVEEEARRSEKPAVHDEKRGNLPRIIEAPAFTREVDRFAEVDPWKEKPVISADPREEKPVTSADPWEAFAASLTAREREALSIVLSGGELKPFADSHGVMAEVLTDAINQKAFDAVGDTVMEYDGRAVVYEDYTDAVKRISIERFDSNA